MIEEKEVSVVKQQATKAVMAAQALTIKTDEDMKSATDVLSKIKTVAKMAKERKEAITRPMTEALNSARDLFKPIEANCAEAESIIKGKMVAWHNAQEKAREDAAKKIVDRVERGTMKAETAVGKLEKLPEVATATQGKVGTVTTKIIKKYRITNEAILPLWALTPNMPVIIEALKGGRMVPGAEVYEEKIISAR